MSAQPKPAPLTGSLDANLRHRIETAIEALIALLDGTEPPHDADPIFPGHPAYQAASIDWSRTAAGSSVDSDTEPDDCDDEDGDEDDDRANDNAVDIGDIAAVERGPEAGMQVIPEVCFLRPSTAGPAEPGIVRRVLHLDRTGGGAIIGPLACSSLPI